MYYSRKEFILKYTQRTKVHGIAVLLDNICIAWLRQCATSRKVAGSRPDEVIECYQCT
jgi:hypothetical protein